jgi:acetyl-CoA C-acetyltransferase
MSVRSPHLGGLVIREAIKRAKIDPKIINDVRFGSCVEDHDALNVARICALLGGVPDNVPAVTINRVCCSAMDAVQSGALQIQSGASDVVVAGASSQ